MSDIIFVGIDIGNSHHKSVYQNGTNRPVQLRKESYSGKKYTDHVFCISCVESNGYFTAFFQSADEIRDNPEVKLTDEQIDLNMGSNYKRFFLRPVLDDNDERNVDFYLTRTDENNYVHFRRTENEEGYRITIVDLYFESIRELVKTTIDLVRLQVGDSDKKSPIEIALSTPDSTGVHLLIELWGLKKEMEEKWEGVSFFIVPETILQLTSLMSPKGLEVSRELQKNTFYLCLDFGSSTGDISIHFIDGSGNILPLSNNLSNDIVCGKLVDDLMMKYIMATVHSSKTNRPLRFSLAKNLKTLKNELGLRNKHTAIRKLSEYISKFKEVCSEKITSCLKMTMAQERSEMNPPPPKNTYPPILVRKTLETFFNHTREGKYKKKNFAFDDATCYELWDDFNDMDITIQQFLKFFGEFHRGLFEMVKNVIQMMLNSDHYLKHTRTQNNIIILFSGGTLVSERNLSLSLLRIMDFISSNFSKCFTIKFKRLDRDALACGGIEFLKRRKTLKYVRNYQFVVDQPCKGSTNCVPEADPFNSPGKVTLQIGGKIAFPLEIVDEGSTLKLPVAVDRFREFESGFESVSRVINEKTQFRYTLQDRKELGDGEKILRSKKEYYVDLFVIELRKEDEFERYPNGEKRTVFYLDKKSGKAQIYEDVGAVFGEDYHIYDFEDDMCIVDVVQSRENVLEIEIRVLFNDRFYKFVNIAPMITKKMLEIGTDERLHVGIIRNVENPEVIQQAVRDREVRAKRHFGSAEKPVTVVISDSDDDDVIMLDEITPPPRTQSVRRDEDRDVIMEDKEQQPPRVVRIKRENDSRVESEETTEVVIDTTGEKRRRDPNTNDDDEKETKRVKRE